ncbi:hypothetical protein F4703DRAFT_1796986 [Phycomyces blakesleeanus]
MAQESEKDLSKKRRNNRYCSVLRSTSKGSAIGQSCPKVVKRKYRVKQDEREDEEDEEDEEEEKYVKKKKEYEENEKKEDKVETIGEEEEEYNSSMDEGTFSINEPSEFSSESLMSPPGLQSPRMFMNFPSPDSSKKDEGTFSINEPSEFSSESLMSPPGLQSPRMFMNFPSPDSSKKDKKNKTLEANKQGAYQVNGVNILNRTDLDSKTAIERIQKRRENHNHIERRRRDLINNTIHEISLVVPNAVHQGRRPNRGHILKAALYYIKELSHENTVLKQQARLNDIINYSNNNNNNNNHNHNHSCAIHSNSFGYTGLINSRTHISAISTATAEAAAVAEAAAEEAASVAAKAAAIVKEKAAVISAVAASTNLRRLEPRPFFAAENTPSAHLTHMPYAYSSPTPPVSHTSLQYEQQNPRSNQVRRNIPTMVVEPKNVLPQSDSFMQPHRSTTITNTNTSPTVTKAVTIPTTTVQYDGDNDDDGDGEDENLYILILNIHPNTKENGNERQKGFGV